MIPINKIFILLIRTFTKPAIHYTKKFHIGKKSGRAKRFFLCIGKGMLRIENEYAKKKRDFFTLLHDMYKGEGIPINETKAINKGLESFFEGFLYFVLVSIPVCEIIIQQRRKEEKDSKIDAKITIFEENLKRISLYFGLDFSSFSIFTKCRTGL